MLHAGTVPAHVVRIFYTASVQGELAHCGCATAKGGLARRAAALHALRADGPSVTADLGDVFLAFPPGGFLSREDAPARAELLAQAHRQLGYDLQVPGTKELWLGHEALKKHFPPGTTPRLLAGNLEQAEGHRAIGQGSVRLTRGGRRLGFVGVTSSEPGGLAGQFLVTDPVAAVARDVAGLRRRGVDAVVVLSHLGYRADRHLAEAVAGIDLIIGGRSRDLFREPRRSTGVPIVQAGVQGKYLGIVTLSWPGGGLEIAHEVLDLDVSLPEDPHWARAVAALLGT